MTDRDGRIKLLRTKAAEALAVLEAIAKRQREAKGLREDQLLELAVDYTMASIAFEDANLAYCNASGNFLVSLKERGIIQELARSSVPVGEAQEQPREVLSPWLETEPVQLDDERIKGKTNEA
jgi:hypothetical protein